MESSSSGSSYPSFFSSQSKIDDTLQYKTVVLGNTDVGKTSIINKLKGITRPSSCTVAATYSTFTLPIDGKSVTLNIWDTVGQERYRSLGSLYYKEASIVILVYSIDSLKSYEDLTYWVGQVKENMNRPLLFLVANKIDLHDNPLDYAVNVKTAKSFALDNNMYYWETSAVTGHNVNSLFFDIVDKAYKTCTPTLPKIAITNPPASTSYCSSCYSGGSTGDKWEDIHT